MDLVMGLIVKPFVDCLVSWGFGDNLAEPSVALFLQRPNMDRNPRSRSVCCYTFIVRGTSLSRSKLNMQLN